MEVLDELTETMYDLCAREWLSVIRKGDTEKEKNYSDYMDICELSLSTYENEYIINTKKWKMYER